jgi:hypothetical protein
MTFRNHWWLVIPLAAALGCAGAQQAQKQTKAGGNSTLVDEGPAAASPQGAAAAGQAAAPQLVPFEGRGGFVVLMPPNPQLDERTQDAPGGQVLVYLAQAQDASGKYLSSLSEFPRGSLDRVKSKELLDSLQQATVQSMGGTLVNSRDVEVGGLPGREFTATDPQGSEVTARIFVGPSRVYTLAGTYPKGEIPGSIQQFLGSFQPPASTAVGGSGEAGGAPDATGTDLGSASATKSHRSASSSTTQSSSQSGAGSQ